MQSLQGYFWSHQHSSAKHIAQDDPLSSFLPIVIFLSMMVLVLFTPFFTSTAHASTLSAHIPLNSCGDASQNHCYGLMNWYGGMNGGKTTIIPHGLISCTQLNNGCMEYTEEMWIGTDDPPSQQGCPSQGCWIEAGFDQATNTPRGLMYSFWADWRPGDAALNQHFMSATGADQTAFTIKRIGLQTFDISAQCNASNCSSWDQQSTGNHMITNCSGCTIQIGSELAGTGSSSIAHSGADFIDNYYYGTDGNAHFQGDGNLGSGLGLFGNAPPPNVKWNVDPRQSSTGGDLFTWT